MLTKSNEVQLYQKIKQHSTSVVFGEIFCITVIVLLTIAVFNSFSKSQNETIKFSSIKDISKDDTLVRNMIRPRVNIEYSEYEYYNMTADEAIQGENDDIILNNVEAESFLGDLKAGKLTLKNEATEFYFEDNPSLVINPN